MLLLISNYILVSSKGNDIIFSFSKYLSSTCYVADCGLGAKDTVGKQELHRGALAKVGSRTMKVVSRDLGLAGRKAALGELPGKCDV